MKAKGPSGGQSRDRQRVTWENGSEIGTENCHVEENKIRWEAKHILDREGEGRVHEQVAFDAGESA